MGNEQVRLSYNLLFNLFFFLFLFLFQIPFLHAQLCSQQQNSALLQLKRSFSFNESASWYNCRIGRDACTCNSANIPKTKSWEEGSDCCSWDGVNCDNKTGQVIGLDISSSCLQGTILPNSSLFLSFPHLQKLNLGSNDLRLEEGGWQSLIQNLSKITHLDLSGLNLSSSVVPISLVNLTSLRTLNLFSSGLHGNFPSGIFHLPHLQELDLRRNEALTGYLPEFMNLSYPLQQLNLSSTGFSGVLPNSVANLKSLEMLNLYNCEFSGSIPTSFWNLTQITYLDLSSNKLSGILTGPLPSQIRVLEVSNNSLTGPLPSQVIAPPNLYYLNVGRNLINGTIPSWVFKVPSLQFLDLGSNELIGHTLEFLSTSLTVIDLSYNNLRGTIPNSTFELPNLRQLILSSNNFSGTIPESNKFGEKLILLDLRKNNFYGVIQDSFSSGNSLEIIDLNSNGFEGPVPKSLVHCTKLGVLDLGNNKFDDKFPHWLEHLPGLHILILRSNRFHGPMLTFKTEFPFPSLRVIDVSNNNLKGPLPEVYFRNFVAMANVDERQLGLQYIQSDSRFVGCSRYYSLNMVIKGSVFGQKVLTYFMAIDLSKNQFEGKIPEIVGTLNSIRGLNLSYNSLTGQIPTSLGNLTKLESLDLSSNKLSGEIPQQLTNLIFLGTLNLSHNLLTGPIPRGKQFDAFLNDSYINNSALCGPPLSNPCGDPKVTPPPPLTFGKEEDSELGSGFWWEVILPGYGFGLVFGIVIGYLMLSFRKPQWLVQMIEGVGNRIEERKRRHVRRHGARRN